MTASSKSVYASPPFKFIVDEKPLYIHADLVSLHSKPLDRMINGNMEEAHKGFATLEEVDEDTFVRFIEWAHKGYYTAPDFTTVEKESLRTSRSENGFKVIPAPQHELQSIYLSEAPVHADPEPDFDIAQSEGVTWDAQVTRKKSKKSKKVDHLGAFGTYNEQSREDTAQDRKGELKEAFISGKYAVRQSALQVPPPRPNQSPEEDYTQVFLSHARLYVFADQYDIQPLKKLTLEELHATLAIYTLYLERTGDIVALLRYVYGNTVEPNEGVEDMRALMTQYVGYEMDTLINEKDFRGLMIEDGGPLLEGFMTMVGRRIS